MTESRALRPALTSISLRTMVLIGILLRLINLHADIPFLQNADDLGDEGYWLTPVRDLLLFASFDDRSNFMQARAGAPLSIVLYYILGKIAGSLTLGSGRLVTVLFASLIMFCGCHYYVRIRKDPLAGLIFIGSYALLPLTVFYGRLAHLEQHLLLYLFGAFACLERGTQLKHLMFAGFLVSLAVLTKLISILVIPAFVIYLLTNNDKRAAALAGFVTGLFPLCLLYGIYLWSNWDLFAPTLRVVASYHATSGFFVDSFSLDYFWLSALVVPYLPIAAAGLIALAVLVFQKEFSLCRHWSFIWLAVIFLELSFWKYQSFARHHLLIFPLLHLSAISISKASKLIPLRQPHTLKLFHYGMTSFVAFGFVTTLKIGQDTFFNPRYTYYTAAQTVMRVTRAGDRVVGPHNFVFSLYSAYWPKMSLSLPAWQEIDPLHSVSPTVVLEPEIYNGVLQTGRIFPVAHKVPGQHEELGVIEYLGRFRTRIVRIHPHRHG